MHNRTITAQFLERTGGELASYVVVLDSSDQFIFAWVWIFRYEMHELPRQRGVRLRLRPLAFGC